MYSVVNTINFAEPIAPGLLPSAEELLPAMRAIEGFGGLHIIQTSDTQAVLLIVADRPETLDRIATEVGSPWMVEHVVPKLAGPPERKIGEVVMTSGL
ncbi:MAG: hypothetical protein U0W40_12580 [Acidimicrobiia bacterium]